MWTDPDTGKTYLRTKSGKIVSEVDDTLVMYTDPKTGKKYLAPRNGWNRFLTELVKCLIRVDLRGC